MENVKWWMCPFRRLIFGTVRTIATERKTTNRFPPAGKAEDRAYGASFCFRIRFKSDGRVRESPVKMHSDKQIEEKMNNFEKIGLTVSHKNER